MTSIGIIYLAPGQSQEYIILHVHNRRKDLPGDPEVEKRASWIPKGIEQKGGKVGEIHLCKEELYHGVLAHEAMHAAKDWVESRVEPQGKTEAERSASYHEPLAQVVQGIVEQAVALLHGVCRFKRKELHAVRAEMKPRCACCSRKRCGKKSEGGAS